MSTLTRQSHALLFAVLAFGCGHRELPPPAAPKAEVPPLPELPAAKRPPGTRRVFLEADGEPAIVEDLTTPRLVRAHDASSADTSLTPSGQMFCIAPCVMDMTLGPHLVHFASTRDDQRASWAKIRVYDRDLVVRHAIGRTDSRTFAQRAALVPAIIGTTVVVGGLTVLGAGLATDDRNVGVTSTNGLIGIGIGAALLALGIPLAFMTQPYHQPGATTEMALVLPAPPPPPAPAAPSLSPSSSGSPPAPSKQSD